ncbi:hypothetical protein Pcinc_028155, partial [Petrolisthes cinctipes]
TYLQLVLTTGLTTLTPLTYNWTDNTDTTYLQLVLTTGLTTLTPLTYNWTDNTDTTYLQLVLTTGLTTLPPLTYNWTDNTDTTYLQLQDDDDEGQRMDDVLARLVHLSQNPSLWRLVHSVIGEVDSSHYTRDVSASQSNLHHHTDPQTSLKTRPSINVHPPTASQGTLQINVNTSLHTVPSHQHKENTVQNTSLHTVPSHQHKENTRAKYQLTHRTVTPAQREHRA